MCQTGVWLWMINWEGWTGSNHDWYEGANGGYSPLEGLRKKNLHNNSVKIAGFQAENKSGFSWICSRNAEHVIIVFSEDNKAYSVCVVGLHMSVMFTQCCSAYLFAVWTKC